MAMGLLTSDTAPSPKQFSETSTAIHHHYRDPRQKARRDSSVKQSLYMGLKGSSSKACNF